MAKHAFQAEMGELLKLMTHSLYSNKEIFLRELISNASDAIDKFRFLHLTDERFKEEAWQGKINIKIDEADNSLTVSDNGIGMNEQDLIDNLGTVARSGTKAFLQQLSGDAKKDANLIGQFGVGFYSVFMVAERVDVITKKAGEEQAYKFSTEGTGEYEIKPVIKEAHGTVIYIKLKEDAKEFLDAWRIKEIVRKYSNHIAYEIMLHYTTTEYEGEGDERKEKKVNKSEQINEATALWTLPKSELKEEDYVEFYQSLAHDSEPPLAYIHNKVEGTLEYTTLFYIPNTAPIDLYRADYEPGVKLYVKRVFITDDDKELLPVYLRFVRGVIDSEDLPLNVSREILQENRIMATIRQHSVKKILEMIKGLEGEKFDRFVSQYNKVMKEGAYLDFTNRETILEILRFKSTHEEQMLVSLQEYLSRNDSEKKEIYYLIGDDASQMRHSPLIEAYKKAGIEVLLCDDKEIDAVVMPSLGEYKSWRFVDVSTVEPPSQMSEEERQASSEALKPLLERLKEKLGDAVKEVRISSRLADSPSCVVKDTSDPMAGMEALMRQMGQEAPKVPLILEINPTHPLIERLKESKEDALLDEAAHLLFESAKLAEGMEIEDKAGFAKRIMQMMQKAI